MRRLIALEFMTLDGVIQSGGGPDEDPSDGFQFGGWHLPFRDEVGSALVKAQMGLSFDLLLGRKTFEIWAPYWTAHSDTWPEVAKAVKYVASNTITEHQWKPSVFLSGNVADKIRALKSTSGPDLHLFGSANLFQTLLRADLVDELWLKIYPLTLGTGKRLFATGTIPAAFELLESHVTPKGVLFANYKRSGGVLTAAG